ncbi:MAG: tetratricopeptide repeat protein [Sedimentisphaerales bacterium]|nr:tetratricopeptide repeat protein [Sedimentisphaerales bacterium]
MVSRDSMLERSKAQRGVAVFIFFAVSASIIYLFLIARYQRDIPFLRTSTEAKWILYYLYPDTLARRDNYAELTTDFIKDFNLSDASPKAELHIRAFKKYRLWINDDELLGSPAKPVNWKKMETLDISRFLVKGKNTIKVQVTCDYGPPALWLYVRGLQEDIRTDTTWLTSISGSPYFAAGLAEDSFVHPIGRDGPRPFQSFVSKLPMLILFFCISCIVFYFCSYMPKKGKLGNRPAISFSVFTPRIVLTVSVVIWAVVFITNAPQISVRLGFDAPNHLKYILYILENRALPLANEGWEAYQPPLFYAVSAVFFSLAELFFGNETAHTALKLVPFLCGIGQIFIAYFASRYVFHNSTNKQTLSTAFAALIPMNIYISHYVSNESLCAFLIGMLILSAIIILSRGSSTKLFCILGLITGLAFLTKLTVLVVLPVVALVLFYKLIAEEKRSLAAIAGNFGLAAAIVIGLAGWFYFRNWINFGEIFIGNWDPAAGIDWWQDPGFHTYKYFCRFGGLFSVPYFSGFYSFYDSIYATFWGDSMLGGRSEYGYGPPWNYEYVSAVYILSLPATVIALIGAVRLYKEAIFRDNKVWLLILGSLFVAIWSVAYMSLRIPYYGQSKAFYGLFVVMPVALIFASGFGAIDELLKSKSMLLVRTVLYGWFGTLALAIFFSFLVVAAPKEGAIDLAALAREGRLNEAVVYYTKLLNKNPNSHYAHVELAKSYINQGRFDYAIEHCKKALEIRPDWPKTLNILSMLLVNKPNAAALEKKQAVVYAERCCQLTGCLWAEALVTLADAYMANGREPLAVRTAQKAMKEATAAGQKNLARRIQNWLESNKTSQPYIMKQN